MGGKEELVRGSRGCCFSYTTVPKRKEAMGKIEEGIDGLEISILRTKPFFKGGHKSKQSMHYELLRITIGKSNNPISTNLGRIPLVKHFLMRIKQLHISLNLDTY